MKRRSSPEQVNLPREKQTGGGGAEEGSSPSSVQQEAPASLHFSSQEEADVSFGVPPPTLTTTAVCMCGCARSSQPLFFSQRLAEARERAADAFSPSQHPGILLRHRRAGTPPLAVPYERRRHGGGKSAESAVDVGNFLNVLSFFSADKQTHRRRRRLVCVCGEEFPVLPLQSVCSGIPVFHRGLVEIHL